jgi:hypothetical protein
MDVTTASDDEILKMGLPGAEVPKDKEEKKEETPAPAPVPAPAAEATPTEQPVEGTPPEGQEGVQGGQEDEPEGEATPAAPAAQGPAQAVPEPKPVEKKPEEGKVTETKPDESGIDYKAFYQRVMGPIKAGGKTITLTNVDEVMSLLQKGVDYTRKTMELSKYRKFGMMLENNGLLDEGKLDLLIAVHNKDPEAIKRFFKQNKLDPVEVDTTTEDKYKEGTHVIPEKTAKLQDAIDDLKAADGGQETLDELGSWDKASKEIIWENPDLLNTLHQQRQTGVFAKVSSEMDRMQALGHIPPGTPKLKAYKMAGDALQAQGKLGVPTNAAPKTPASAGGQTPVTRRPASPTTTSAPGKSAAKAAAATRTTPGSTKVVPNFMAMSDEEFLKAKV